MSRTRDFRRKQLAKHFNKRAEIYSLYGNFGRSEIRREDFENAGEYYDVYDKDKPKYNPNGSKIQNKPIKLKIKINNVSEIKKKRWAKKLKNGDVKLKLWDKWNKKYCNRTRRHFQKLVDYKLPEKRFLDRCQVIYPREIV